MDFLFLNPLFLLGALGVAAPLYVHLRQRQRARKIQFSTLRFLKSTDRHTARRHKIVDLLALALRCAIVVLLAVGLSRPIIRPKGANALGASTGRTFWAIVLDDSYSMDVLTGGETPFGKGKEAVKRVLGMATEGDEVALILTSGRKLPGLAESTHQKYQIEAALETLKASAGASSVADGVERALTLIRDSTQGAHEMIVITDLQGNNLEQMAKIDPLRLTEKLASMHLLDVGVDKAVNETVTEVKASRAGPYPGIPITFRASLRHTGGETVDREVTLNISGEQAGKNTVRFDDKGRVDVSFRHVIMEPGEHVATIHVAGDGLETDNSRRVACDVYRQVSVLLVADPADPAAPWDAAFFLDLALAPQSSRSVLAEPPVRVTRKTPAEASSGDLHGYQVVICADVRSMTPATLQSLKNYVRDGGVLIVFAGYWAAAGQSGFYADSELFGWKCDGIWKMDNASDEPPVMGSPDMAHPIFRALADDPSIDLQSVQFYQHVSVPPDSLDSDSHIVVSLSDGAPYILEKRLGQGSTLCFTAPPTPEWTSLPTRPMFLPLIHESVKHSLGAAGSDARRTVVGQPFETPAPKVSGKAPASAILIDPAGVRSPLPMKRNATALEVPALEQPGQYTIELAYEPGVSKRIRVLADVDPTEGDLTRAGEKELDAWLPARDKWFLHDNDRAMIAALERKREGVSLSTFLLGTALVLFMFESYLVNLLLPAREKVKTAAVAMGVSPAKAVAPARQ